MKKNWKINKLPFLKLPFYFKRESDWCRCPVIEALPWKRHSLSGFVTFKHDKSTPVSDSITHKFCDITTPFVPWSTPHRSKLLTAGGLGGLLIFFSIFIITLKWQKNVGLQRQKSIKDRNFYQKVQMNVTNGLKIKKKTSEAKFDQDFMT